MSEYKNIGAEKLRIAMVKNDDMKLAELARLTNMSAPNISNKFKRNNFCETELRKLADTLGYDVELTLVSRDTGEQI